MIDYVVESNPDDRILRKASQVLMSGGLVCFPTETNWIVVANPFSKEGVDKLYRLRHIENTKHLTVLTPNFSKAMEIAHIPDGAFSLLKKVTPGSYTFIFEAKKIITKHLKASRVDHQVGLRFPPTHLCQKILSAHEDVVITSSLSHSMFEEIEPDFPIYSALIEDKFGNMIDLIIDPGEVEFLGSTSIIDYTSGSPEVIREGIGDLRYFQR